MSDSRESRFVWIFQTKRFLILWINHPDSHATASVSTRGKEGKRIAFVRSQPGESRQQLVRRACAEAESNMLDAFFAKLRKGLAHNGAP